MATKTTEKETVVLETLRAEPGITEIELAVLVKPLGVKRLDTVLKSLRNKRLVLSLAGFGLMAVDNGEPPVIDTIVGLPVPESEPFVPHFHDEPSIAAAKPKKARKPKEGTPCLCDCGQITKGGAFRPGHDVKFHAKLKAGTIPLTNDLINRIIPFIVDKPIVGKQSEAKKPRACDAKCEFAMSHKCNCACGGANHQQAWKAFIVEDGGEKRAAAETPEWDWDEDSEVGE